jgi:hypothetical protein
VLAALHAQLELAAEYVRWSRELKADREVVLASVAQKGRALRHASAELQADREVVLVAVAQEGEALRHAPAELQADREVVVAAVAQSGDALRYASAELRSDREVVVAAVAQSGDALRYASAGMRRFLGFRRYQRLLLAVMECRGADCRTAPPLLQQPLPLSTDVREMVLRHLWSSSAVPNGPLAFAWHEAY